MDAPVPTTTLPHGSHGSTGNLAPMVDRVIGSSYDVVRYVAYNLEYIKHVSAHLEEIYKVSGSVEEIVAIAEQLDKLLVIYNELASIITVADDIEHVVNVSENMEALLVIKDNLPELIVIHDNLLAFLQVIRDFATRQALVTHIATYPGGAVPGRVYNAEGYQYVGKAGATDIPDLPGLVPMNMDVSNPGTFFKTDGTQAQDVTAITAMMDHAEVQLSRPAYIHGEINLSSLYTHPDTESFFPVLSAFWASPEAEGGNFVFDSKRAWVGGSTRPSGSVLGPQGQYLTPPQRCTIRWAREWDLTGWTVATSQPSILRRQGNYGYSVPITNSGGLHKGVTYTLTVADTTQFKKGMRVLIRATHKLDSLIGAFSLVDAEIYFPWVAMTGSNPTNYAKGFIVSQSDLYYVCVIDHAATTFAADLAAGKWVLYTFQVPMQWAPGINYDIGTWVLGPDGISSKCINAHTSSVYANDIAFWTPAGFASRAEDAIVYSTNETQITLNSPVLDEYDPTCMPVVQPYLNEPEIHLINPCIQSSGMTPSGGGDRAINIFYGRNTRIEGGYIKNSATSIKLYATMGGCLKDIEVHASDAGTIGGVFYFAEMSDFVIENVKTWRGGQPFMVAGSGYTYGISRRLKFKDSTSYGAIGGGFTQHNLNEQMEYDNCRVINCLGSAFDIRGPNNRLTNCYVENAGSNGVIMRISPNDTEIDGLTINGARSGILLENSNVPEYDYDPANFTITNCDLRNIGGVGTAGGICFVYGQLRGGLVPTLGKLNIIGNRVENIDGGRPITVAGKWNSPVVANNDIYGLAASSGAPIHLHDAATGTGTMNPVIVGNTWGANHHLAPLITFFTGRVTSERNVQRDATTLTTIASGSSITPVHGATACLVSGTTTINRINYGANFVNKEFTFIFLEPLTVNHNVATSGVAMTILLHGNTNRKVVAGDTLTLVSDGTAWREKARSGGIIRTTLVHDFPSINANSFQYVSVTVIGAELGDRVSVSTNLGAPAGAIILKGQVAAADTVYIHALNITTASVDLGLATYYIEVVKAW